MLIDLHGHTSGISTCCKAASREILEAAKRAGIDGIALTNHYHKPYIKDGDHAAFAKRYVDEFYKTREIGKELGVTVLFGIEISAEMHERRHILVYGVAPEFVLEHPCVFDLAQKDLYSLVKSVNGVVIQAHPYRKGGKLLDPAYLDGVEINCHPLYGTSDSERVIETANTYGLTLTCGGDYHTDTYRCTCGMHLPDSITDGVALGRYIADAKQVRLRVHEPYGSIYDMEYTRRTVGR